MKKKVTEKETNISTGTLNESGISAVETSEVRPFDFAHPDKLSKSNLRALRLVFSGLERPWAVTISTKLKTDAQVSLLSFDQMQFSAYAKSMSEHAVLFAISMQPLRGYAIADVSAEFALKVIDRLAGGKGELPKQVRPLSNIERRIIGRFLSSLMPGFASAWKPVASVEAIISQSFLSVEDIEIEPEELVVVASMVLNSDLGEYKINIILPVSSLDPVLKLLDPQRWLRVETPDRSTPEQTLAMLLNDVPIPASVQLGRARISVKDVLGMEVGDVVRLDTMVNDPLLVRIGGEVRFLARPGLVGKRVSVQVIDRAEQDVEVKRMVSEESAIQ